MKELVVQNVKETIYNDKSGLDLTNEEAKAFFIKSETYCSIDLPPYFNFESLLSNVDSYLKDKNIASCFKTETLINEDGETKSINHKPYNF
ncbi:MAG: hypothetical protein ORN53_06165, partial [Crocinitomicaceae bacterium]|nr:hypothetical protein [Crocinitomicaceae bacterium]